MTPEEMAAEFGSVMTDSGAPRLAEYVEGELDIVQVMDLLRPLAQHAGVDIAKVHNLRVGAGWVELEMAGRRPRTVMRIKLDRSELLDG